MAPKRSHGGRRCYTYRWLYLAFGLFVNDGTTNRQPTHCEQWVYMDRCKFKGAKETVSLELRSGWVLGVSRS